MLLVVGSALGFLASFALTLDKIAVLQNPDATLNCDFSLIVQCGANLNSPEGSIFGFPNALLGIAGFSALLLFGVAMLANVQFPRWMWLALNAALLGALVFVIWLISVSIFRLGTLCPWCMLVWSVTIPMFLAVTFANGRSGALPIGRRGNAALAAGYAWLPFITLLCFVAVALVAQARLDVVQFL